MKLHIALEQPSFALNITLPKPWLDRPVSKLLDVFAERMQRKFGGQGDARDLVVMLGGQETASEALIASLPPRVVVRSRTNWLAHSLDPALAAFGGDSGAKAQKLLQAGRPDEALVVADAALNRCFRGSSPSNDLGLTLAFSKAAALGCLGRWRESERWYVTARGLCADTARYELVSHNLVGVLVAAGDRAAAQDAARLAAQRVKSCESLYELGAVADGAEAISAFEGAIRANPHHAPSYVNLVQKLELRDVSEAANAAAAAIERRVLWSHALQRPPFWFPGLDAKPWWDSRHFWFAQLLESNYDAVRAEFQAAFAGTEVGERSGFAHDASLKVQGSWREHVFYAGGGRVDATCRRFPQTAALVDRIQEATGAAMCGCGETLFSTLAPGTVLRPHCGSTNARLTMHFGIVVPSSSQLFVRCGTETRQWQEGKCIVFDDSFEHEVQYNDDTTKGPRTVLLINFWHPQLSQEHQNPKWRRLARHGDMLQAYEHAASSN